MKRVSGVGALVGLCRFWHHLSGVVARDFGYPSAEWWSLSLFGKLDHFILVAGICFFFVALAASFSIQSCSFVRGKVSFAIGPRSLRYGFLDFFSSSELKKL